MKNRSAHINSMLALSAAVLSAALLWGCDSDADMDNDSVSGKVGEAVEETRESAASAGEETGDMIEETGDRIESATD